jgi:hypothetical protein
MLFEDGTGGIMKILIAFLVSVTAFGQEAIPRLVNEEGKFTFLVDDKPFIMLGAQVHNSSGWPSELDSIWPQYTALHANTAEIPIYWEQFEPEPGVYDYSVLDEVILGARKSGLRVVLLWFATWKNGTMDYVPAWVKDDPVTYPHMIGPDGKPVRVLSPHSENNLNADKRAFAAFMKRIKKIDEKHRTVITVQVQNEPGSLFIVRDYSEAAEKAFSSPVPAELMQKIGRTARTWSGVFGEEEAEEAFAAYHVATYIDQLAEAGKAIYPLPMTVNVWLKERKAFERPGENYPSGGATSNMLDVWKAAAPHIDVLAPDIYVLDYAGYREICDNYSRPDNPLLVPETGGSGRFAQYRCYAIGDYGAIGFAPFGFNQTGGVRELHERLNPMAGNFRLIGGAMPVIAELGGTDRLKAAVEEDLYTNRLLRFEKYDVLAQWGSIRTSYGGEVAAGTAERTGRVLVGQAGEHEF